MNNPYRRQREWRIAAKRGWLYYTNWTVLCVIFGVMTAAIAVAGLLEQANLAAGCPL